MFWSFCSPKGGVGTSVVAASVAAVSAATRPTLVVDFGGDMAQILGVDTLGRQGINDWLAASSDVGAESLDNLHIEVSSNLALLPCGSAPSPNIPVERVVHMVRSLHSGGRDVIADVGTLASPSDPRAIACVSGDRTTCVIRACYLTLRRFSNLPVTIDDIVEIEEPGRALRTIDIEAVARMPVSARIPLDPAIARAVDAGLLNRRLPRNLRRNAQTLIASGHSVGVAA